jgi:pyruvate dehydrogenase kinase 2/3/4
MVAPAKKNLLDRIDYLSQFKQRPVSLKQLFDFGLNSSAETLLTQARFLHQELPVRLSHRVQELRSLPFGLSDMPSVQLLRDMYIDSVRELIEFSCPEIPSDDREFIRLIGNIKQRHKDVVSIMARGILELKRALGEDTMNGEIQKFLDRFYISRIGLRMLIGQHVALHAVSAPGHVGLISENCRPKKIAQGAISDARNLCRLHYGVAPEVGIFGNVDLKFTYVPSHLHHMLFELLKNSMRAVVELHGAEAESLPMIRLVFSEGTEDVTIKTSDEGGGIPRSGVSRIWTYLFSTAAPPDLDNCSPYQADFGLPFAGLGYGLPISRLYSRYFGGDLQVLSMEGYGTDAYLHLKRLADTQELLPRKLY